MVGGALAGWLGLAALQAAAPPIERPPQADLGERLAVQADPAAVRVVPTPAGARLHCGLQDLVGTVTPSGLCVESVSESEGGGELVLRPRGWGRPDQLQPAGPGEVVVVGTRVYSHHRAGPAQQPAQAASLVEEFTTSGAGIRHDLVVLARPAGAGDLLVSIELAGAAWTPVATGAHVRLSAGRELTYDQLAVTDAAGRRLTAQMEAGPGGSLDIRVDDHEADYPVRIDPTISDANWRSLGGLPGANGKVLAAVVTPAGDLVVGGEFTAVGEVAASRIARWDGSRWQALGTGMTNGSDPCSVKALAVGAGGDLYAGGQFTLAGGVTANHIARWDGTTWNALGSGMNATGDVAALAWTAPDLYVGGEFTAAGGTPATNVARWDGAGWAALGAGVVGRVNAMAVLDGVLCAAGRLPFAGNVATWNGTAWGALGGGVNDQVYALTASGTVLYAAGDFSSAGGTAAACIARWDGTAWAPLGAGLNVTGLALAATGSSLYVGGQFSTAGDATAKGVAKWDGTAWSGLGDGMAGGLSYAVRALAASGSLLYAGGDFDTAGGTPAAAVAAWDGAAWSALGDGMDAAVSALAVSGTDLYAAGSFTRAGRVPARYVARWDGSEWHALGDGLGLYAEALAVSGTTVYVGGQFTTAGGVAANRVARWDGTAWSALGTGMENRVRALAVVGQTLYAGGDFTTAGGRSALRIARWNGSSWNAVGTGMDGAVQALAGTGTEIFAGGTFETAGGVSASRIARWNGTAWAALGSGLNAAVRALAATGSGLYVGGDFTQAGGLAASRVAKWDGTAWAALGSGVGSTVMALAAMDTDLYAGGAFTTVGGAPASYIARWDGSAWSALGSGTNGFVRALATDSSGSLYAGGMFTLAGGKASAYAARLAVFPFPTVTSPAAEFTPLSPIPFTVTFSVPVTGFAQDDLRIANGVVAAFAGAEADYQAMVTPAGQGPVTVSVDAGVCVDEAGTPNRASVPLSRTYDSVAPTVTDVSSTTPDGTYGPGTAISLTVAFSEPVTVTGTPQLLLETGATDAVAVCSAGKAAATLTFLYTVAIGDESPDLDCAGTTALRLNGGSIRDAAGNDADLALPTPAAPHSLGANSNLVIAMVHTVTAVAGAHGRVEGALVQTVLHGGSGTPLAAVADFGYVFEHWSDGSTVNPRTPQNVLADGQWEAQFREAGAVPPNGPFRSPVSTAEATAGEGFWDPTGGYSLTVGGQPLTLAVTVDTKGKALGMGTLQVNTGKALVPVAMPIKGSIKGASGTVLLTLSMKGADAAKTAGAALTLNLTLNATRREFTGPATGSITANGASTPVNETVPLSLPAGMDGSWRLDFALAQGEKAITGTAVLTLSNGAAYHYLAKGKLAGPTGAALGLKAEPTDLPAKGIKIKVTIDTLEGDQARIRALSAKGLGQSVVK